MVHLRIVAPDEKGRRALELLEGSGSVCNVIVFPDAARKPRGDVLMCDVAREDASAIIEDLRRLDIPSDGSIALEYVDSEISEAAERAVEYAPGLPSDAVVWEEVEARTEEMTEFSLSFMAFMVLAMLIASVGILLDQPVLIVGAMVVGPEFGPLAALSVAIVERRGALVRRSVRALAVGFPVGILVTAGVTLAFEASGQIPGRFDPSDHPLTSFISDPGFFSVFVAFIAGTAGVLSLTSAKSGPLIGVLISVTTIPAAANIGVGVALSGSGVRPAGRPPSSASTWRRSCWRGCRCCSPSAAGTCIGAGAMTTAPAALSPSEPGETRWGGPAPGRGQPSPTKKKQRSPPPEVGSDSRAQHCTGSLGSADRALCTLWTGRGRGPLALRCLGLSPRREP